MKKIVLFAGILLFLTACSKLDVYEKTVFFSRHEWSSAERPSFTFTIEDTTVPYNLFVTFRHEDAYHFNNLWLNVTIQAPNDTARAQQVNLVLADNKKGWLGTGMDDIFDHRVRITRIPVQLKKGNYIITLQQQMREDPLLFAMNAGIRVEKVLP